MTSIRPVAGSCCVYARGGSDLTHNSSSAFGCTELTPVSERNRARCHGDVEEAAAVGRVLTPAEGGAIDLPGAHVPNRFTDTIATLTRSDTAVGPMRWIRVPSPIPPTLFSPQHFNEPPPTMAQVREPVATPVAPLTPGTSYGVECCVVVASPSWPKRLYLSR